MFPTVMIFQQSALKNWSNCASHIKLSRQRLAFERNKHESCSGDIKGDTVCKGPTEARNGTACVGFTKSSNNMTEERERAQSVVCDGELHRTLEMPLTLQKRL